MLVVMILVTLVSSSLTLFSGSAVVDRNGCDRASRYVRFVFWIKVSVQCGIYGRGPRAS